MEPMDASYGPQTRDVIRFKSVPTTIPVLISRGLLKMRLNDGVADSV